MADDDSSAGRTAADPGDAGGPREEARHSIGLVAERTGLSTHVLRAWENRYGAVEPARTGGGHRAYSDRQLHRLHLLARLTGLGHRIGRIATLPTEELERMMRREREEAAGPGAGDGRGGTEAARAAEREEAADPFLERALEAVQRYDGEGLEDVLRRAALLLSARALVEEVAAPLLEELGERWSAGDLGPGQEHLASAALERVLAWVRDGFAPAAGAPALVVSTPAGQAHRLGALLAATLAAAQGWRVHDLGADLPAAEIARAARETGARAVAISVVYPPGRKGTAGELRTLADLLPEGVALLVGGRASGSHDETLEEVEALRLPGLAAFRRELARLEQGGAAGEDGVPPAEEGDGG